MKEVFELERQRQSLIDKNEDVQEEIKRCTAEKKAKKLERRASQEAAHMPPRP